MSGETETIDRYPALGFFNYAASYHAAADLVLAGALRSTHPDEPVFALYYHAVELYLKAFIRLHGDAESHLRTLGHKFRKLRARAVEHGLVLSDREREILDVMADSDLWSRSRYIEVGYLRRPETRDVADLCVRLEKLVGKAMAAKGHLVRPRAERGVRLKLRPVPDQPAPLQEKCPDYHVMHGGLRVGRIYRHPAATVPDQEWFWEINGVDARLDVLTISGSVGSLDEAKAELKANWQKWLAWAELSDP